ncbi:DUF11 domain-containing protein [Miltoncostaea marina]|uniref:DUF11 domain-containing protein n=1 Tax=Miltoncostaea marina TaxID=2843215 RepID=UPI001C3CBBF9|nr:DUF11 domain-containing protein [Miltoncostaea marina]
MTASIPRRRLMAASSPRRRLMAAAALVLVAVACLPAMAAAAQPGTVRLLGIDRYDAVTVTTPAGARVTTVPGRLTLRVSATGGGSLETGAFCADIHHPIGTGTDYAVSLRTAADDPALATPRALEAAWLAGRAEALIAAAPPAARALESGALQIAVWQLTGQARETSPTGDAALDARAAAIRALAAGRAPGGAVAITAATPRGCAGGTVALALTGVPGSSASLSATGGATVTPLRVRFDAQGRASASVASGAPGAVTVTARAEDAGTLVRAARASAAASTPQQTVFLAPVAAGAASVAVTFGDCPLAPFDGGGGQSGPAGRPGPDAPPSPSASAPREETSATTGDGPLRPSGAPAAPARPADRSARRPGAGRTPARALRVAKSAPRRVRAGAVLRYVVRVANRGRAALRAVEVADRLPAGMSLAAMPRGASLRAGRVVWTLPVLRPGATRVLRLAARIDRDAAGRLCNRVVAGAAGVPAATATACTSVRSVRRSTAAVTA